MITIHKQVLALTYFQKLEVEKHTQFLHVNIQMGNLCIWYKCTPDTEKIKRKIYIHGTGHEILDPSAEYIGTFMIEQQTLVFHVFAEKEKE